MGSAAGMTKLTALFAALALEVSARREPLVDALRAVIYHLDSNERLYSNMVKLHKWGECDIPQLPHGNSVSEFVWSSWSPENVLLSSFAAHFNSFLKKARPDGSLNLPKCELPTSAT